MDCYHQEAPIEILKNKNILEKKYTNEPIINPSDELESENKKKSKKGKKNNKNKCYFCKAKLSLVNFECNECNYKFCTKCRFPEEHKCIGLQNKIDKEKKLLDENNPVIDFKKVDKI